MAKTKRVHRPRQQTPEQQARERATRKRFQREKPSLEHLVASGDYAGPFRHGDYLNVLKMLATLKSAREAAGLSLADVSSASGIDRSAISKLENGLQNNPTIHTLLRYARAIGKSVVVQLEDTDVKRPAVQSRSRATR